MAQNKTQETRSAGERKRGRAARRRLALPKIGVGRAVLFLLFAGAIYGLLVSGQPPLGVELGKVSVRDFKARTGFARTNLEATRATQEQARLDEPPVFRLVQDQWDLGVEELLTALREGQKSLIWQGMPDGFDRGAMARLTPTVQDKIDRVTEALQDLSQQYLVSPTDLARPLVQAKETPQALLREPSGEEREVLISALVPLDGETEQFRKAFAPALEALEPPQAALARQGFALVLRPNVELDLERTVENAEKAGKGKPEVTEMVEKGRLLLAKGSEVRSQHVDDLTNERREYWDSPEGRMVRIQQLFGLAVLLLIVMGGAVAYVKRYRPELLTRRPQMLSFALLTLALVATARLCVAYGISPLWVPVPMMVMIMCLVYDQPFGVGVAFFYALLVRLGCAGADLEFFVLFLGGTVAALLTGKVRARSTLIVAGILTGGVQFWAVWGVGLISALDGTTVPLRFWQSPLLVMSLVGLANGVLSGFVVSGILPGIERLFGVTTDIRLLEWSDPNQPLLQRLLLDAPGSYHHSMVVGSLAAEAAEAIGANPLLARVSAYFHDVGKLKKPEYFAENLPEGAKNPHDELSPTMSSLIITAHPKEGAEMAETYGVPLEVRDVILQSHGSSVVKYFWGKAKDKEAERSANGTKHGEMEERTFRYRMPKPQSKEAAVVMLCDAVESAARSLKSPSTGQLRNLVRGIILDRLHDGQLDNSGLTITDMKQLEDSLVRGLTAVFHNRVSYPDQDKLEGQEETGQEAAPSARSNSNAGGSVQQAERP